LRGRKRVGTVVRVVATVVMLFILVPRLTSNPVDIDWLRPATIAWLSAALIVTFVGIVLSALRWQRVLVALDVRTRIRWLLSTYLASLFVSNFLPSTIGGDVLRITRLSASNVETPRSFASVVLERMTGWLVLPVITLAALALNPTLLHLARASRLALTVSFGTLVLLGVVLWAAAHPRIGGRLASRTGWRRFTGAVHFGLDRFRRNPGAAAEVLAAGFVYQLAVVLAAFLAARALGISIGWTAIMAFFPAVAIIQVLPFPTIGGLGVREGALVLFLGPLGVSQSHAIALGLLVYAVNLSVSLLGAPSFAVGRRSANTSPAPA
jgi:uncharacterized protein (TIRG00374 family)